MSSHMSTTWTISNTKNLLKLLQISILLEFSACTPRKQQIESGSPLPPKPCCFGNIIDLRVQRGKHKKEQKKNYNRSPKRFANMDIFSPQSKFNHSQFQLEAME